MSHFDDWCEGCRVTGLELYELESKGLVSLYEMRRLPDNDPFRHNLSYAIWDCDELVMTTRNLMYAYHKYDKCVKSHCDGKERMDRENGN